jgi:Protein of unknown function (DUF3995)
VSIAAWTLTAILGGIALFHALWGLGFSVPAADRQALALLVMGRPVMPGAVACFVVAAGVGVLGGLAVLLGNGAVTSPAGRLLLGVAGYGAVAVFALRGIGGYLPAFAAQFPLEPFATMNRLVYSPLCLLIAGLFLVVLRGR